MRSEQAAKPSRLRDHLGQPTCQTLDAPDVPHRGRSGRLGTQAVMHSYAGWVWMDTEPPIWRQFRPVGMAGFCRARMVVLESRPRPLYARTGWWVDTSCRAAIAHVADPGCGRPRPGREHSGPIRVRFLYPSKRPNPQTATSSRLLRQI